MFAAVPFVNSQQSGYEPLAGASPYAVNVVVDAIGSVRRRPGIKASTGILETAVDSNGLDALHVAHNGQFYAIGGLGAGRSVYRIAAAASQFTGALSELAGTAARPVVAETEAMLVMAAGTYVQKVEFATQLCDRLGGSPPANATHVVANGSRLLINDTSDKNRIHHSAVATGTATAGHEQWNGAGTSGSFIAGARPDPIQALDESTNDVFAFGGTNVQIFSPVASQTDRYAAAAAREYGCIAPYSVVKSDQSFMWLDHKRRFIYSDGREYDDSVGRPIQQTLDDMGTITDCFGYRVHLGAVDALCFCFPTDTRTFVFQKGAGWGIWSGWENTLNTFKRFMVNCHHQRADTGQNMVGTVDGKIGELSTTTYTDLGSPIVARVDTGFLNRDTEKRKYCRALNLSLKRGETTGTESPVAWVSWRDDGGEFNQPVPVELGEYGDREIVYPIRSLGVYRRRQWRFEFSGSDELVLVKAEEEYEILDN